MGEVMRVSLMVDGWQVCSGEDDVVDGDEDKLDEVADSSHDYESNSESLQNFHVLFVVGLLGLFDEVNAVILKLHHGLVRAWLLLLGLSSHFVSADTLKLFYF